MASTNASTQLLLRKREREVIKNEQLNKNGFYFSLLKQKRWDKRGWLCNGGC